MSGKPRQLLYLLVVSALLIIVSTPLMAQTEEHESFSADELLKEAFLLQVDVFVTSPNAEEELWHTEVDKITIPGRAVSVGLTDGHSRLKVVFTLYPAVDGKLLLVAQSEIWFEGEYSSSLTSLPMAHRDEVHYYPLGRIEDDDNENPVEVRMSINTEPYLDTLADEERAALLSTLDSSAQFDLSGEDR